MELLDWKTTNETTLLPNHLHNNLIILLTCSQIRIILLLIVKYLIYVHRSKCSLCSSVDFELRVNSMLKYFFSFPYIEECTHLHSNMLSYDYSNKKKKTDSLNNSNNYLTIFAWCRIFQALRVHYAIKETEPFIGLITQFTTFTEHYLLHGTILSHKLMYSTFTRIDLCLWPNKQDCY